MVRRQVPAFKPDVLRELFLLRECAHPCILHTYGAFWPDDDCSEDDYAPPIIVTELMTFHLEDALDSPVLADIETKRAVLIDIAHALAHLHSKNVVHRDVKPENVLLRVVDGELVRPAKLSDFGVSRKLHQTRMNAAYASTRGPSGTIVYMPPEVIQDTSRCVTRRSWDVWSFGLLACVVAGRREAFALSESEFMVNGQGLARDGRLAQAAWKWADSIADLYIRNTAKRCLDGDHTLRVSMDMVPSMLSSISTLEEGTEAFFKFWESGERQDGVRAAQLFQSAWQNGAVKAAHWLAYCQQLGLTGSWSDSLETYERGGAQGDAMCLGRLGVCRLLTASTQSEKEKAIEILRKACEAGDVVAVDWVADCYLYSFGVPKDRDKWRELRREAERGVEEALDLAWERQLDALEYGELLFLKGWWAPELEQRAQLYARAYHVGNFDARARLLSMGFTLEEGASPMKLGCGGSLLGMLTLGLYLLGKVGPQRRDGFALLEKAADLGYGRAQYFVGKCFQQGVVVAQSASVADKYFRGAEGKFSYDESEDRDKWWDKYVHG